MSHIEVLESELRIFEIDLASEQKFLLARYCEELVRWNQKINLTALSGPDLVRRLIIEPLWIGHQLKPEGVLVDIGSCKENAVRSTPLAGYHGSPERCRLIAPL